MRKGPRKLDFGSVTGYAEMPTPWGEIRIWATDLGVSGLVFADEQVHSDANVLTFPNPFTDQAVNEVREYLAGNRKEFSVPLDLHGTEFQKRVWAALLTIPSGTTTTYGELATLLGDPNLSRAVGLANGSNPVSIIAPCHRVIGSTGLVGYAGGLARKEALLKHEGALPSNLFD